MAKDSLQRFIEGIRSAWGPLDSALAAGCREELRRLSQAPGDEAWLTSLIRDLPATRELHRDPDHGFLLLAHAERRGHHRPPHDHGRGWVVYAVLRGEMEMTTYARVEDGPQEPRLVKRESYVLRPGEARVYLPGDIHSTRYLSGEVLVLRFTSRDLEQEEKEGWLRRYRCSTSSRRPGTEQRLDPTR